MKYWLLTGIFTCGLANALVGEWDDAITVAASEVKPEFVDYQTFQVLYPPKSRELGEAGRVTIELLVGENGRVLDTKPIDSLYPRLSAACARPHFRLIYRPFYLDGVARKFRFQTSCTFQMHSQASTASSIAPQKK